MTMKKELTVSVVAYKTASGILNNLFRCLLGANLDLEILVIDNSPTDIIKEICKGEKFTYIFNNKNVGYGAGHNIAIKKAINRSRYHLVINPDISFEKGALEKIYNFMEDNPDVGLVIPKVLACDGSIDYSSKLLPKPQNLFFRRFGFVGSPFKPLIKKMNSLYELRFTGYNRIMEIPFASGCFMFIRNEVFEKVGIFDERFFMYLEDCDLTRRVHKYYRTVHYPRAIIYHRNRRGSYREFTILRHHIVSAIRYFNKWGWFFDKERRAINKRVLEKFRAAKS